MISITLSSEISEACPDLHVLAIACQVKNTEPDERLWEEITRVEEDIRSTCKIEDINKWTPIFATRQAYKRLGKDPLVSPFRRGVKTADTSRASFI
mgnify:CR=1 FL=1